jgi:hypothetical protein
VINNYSISTTTLQEGGAVPGARRDFAAFRGLSLFNTTKCHRRMRLIKILLSAILLSCFSVQAQSGGPGEAGDIAVPSISAANMDVPAPIISAPSMDMPKPNPKPLVKPKNDTNTLNTPGNVGSNQTQVTKLQHEPEPMNVSGKWSIKFNDSTDRSLDLNLWSSSGNRIMGYGTLTETGAKNSVAASGSVGAQGFTLIVKSASPDYADRKDKEFDIDLFMVNGTLSGTYVQKSGGQFLGKGNASAVKQ